MKSILEKTLAIINQDMVLNATSNKLDNLGLNLMLRDRVMKRVIYLNSLGYK